MLCPFASVNFLLPRMNCLLEGLLARHCPALFLLLLPQSRFPCGTPVVHAGRCRTHRGTLPTLPCCPPFTRGPLPEVKPPNRPTDRPLRLGRGAASAQLSQDSQDNNVLPSSSCPPVTTVRSKHAPPPRWRAGGRETWQMGYAPRPRAGKMEQHSSPSSGTLALWVILPASQPPHPAV